jgi:WD40 repeat protein/serine/threonine protein kinase
MPSSLSSVETILCDAVEISDEDARRAYLQVACGGDARLRAEVERLLENHFRAGDFLESPAFDARPAIAASVPAHAGAAGEGVGTVIGHYRLLEQIGQGGMGQVFVAGQSWPVKRRVALKVVRMGMDSKSVVARFEAERQALAMMDHPNIARVFDGGTTPLGRPYFVMELVRGLPITEYCDQARLTPRQRLGLFLPVCQAVQHAHQKGVIHRDLKPSNVLVTLHDGEPVPKVIDFGIAKALHQRLSEHTVYTEFLQVLGTPAYMSPEQVALSGQDIDTRSDVYSLGVLLYELLTGTTPFDAEALAAGGFDGMRRMIRETEPDRPSLRVSTLSATARTATSERRGVETRRLTHALQGEIDWVVMKALEKDRDRRYESARDLASDVQHYLNDEPVTASPPSTFYRFRKFTRRNAVLLATTLLIATALVIGMIGTIWQAIRATHAEQTTSAALALARDERRRADRHLMAARLRLAREVLGSGQVERVQEILDEFPPPSQGRGSHGFVWDYLHTQARREIVRYPSFVGQVRTFAMSRNGRILAYGEASGVVVIWDRERDRWIGRLLEDDSPIDQLAVSEDGRLAALGTYNRSLGRYDSVRVWDIASRRKLGEVSGHGIYSMEDMAFLSDGKHLAFIGATSGSLAWVTILVRLNADGSPSDIVQRWPSTGESALSARGDFLVASLPGGELARIDPVRGSRTWAVPVPGSGARRAQISEDGRRFASLENDHLVVRDAGDGREIARVSVAEPPVSLLFSPAARYLAAIDPRGQAMVHDLDAKTPSKLFEARGAEGDRQAHLVLAFSPDETRLAIVGWGAPGGSSPLTLRDIGTGATLATYPRPLGHVGLMRFAEDGESLFHNGDTALKQWRLDRADRGGPSWLEGHRDEAWCVAFHPDGSLLLSGGDDTDEPQTVKVWERRSGRLLGGWKPQPGTITALAYSPDGLMLATASLAPAENLRLWDAGMPRSSVPPRMIAELEGHPGWVRSLSFSPDGRLLASGGDDGMIRIWELSRRSLLFTLEGHPDKVRHLAFSPDGRRLASASNDRNIRVWDLREKRAVLTLRRPTEQVSVAFSPDGSLLAGVEQGGVVSLWGAADGQDRGLIHADDEGLQCLAFSPDGQFLATAGKSRIIRVCDVMTGQELLSLDGHAAAINGLAFSPDGRTLASCGHDGAVALWRSVPERSASDLDRDGPDEPGRAPTPDPRAVPENPRDP